MEIDTRNEKPPTEDILGTPLKCYFLAAVNEKHAKQLTIRNRLKPLEISDMATIKSVFGLYNSFVEHSIEKRTGTRETHERILLKKQILTFHKFHAVELLFPEISNCISNQRESFGKEVEKVGILMSNEHGEFEFLHRTLAEYFAGLFLAEFWADCEGFEAEFADKIGHYFLKTIMRDSDYEHTRLLYKLEDVVDSFRFSRVLWFLDNTYGKFYDKQVKKYSMDKFHKLILSRGSMYSDLLGKSPMWTFRSLLKKRFHMTVLACLQERLISVLFLMVELVKVFFTLNKRPALIGPTDHKLDGFPSLIPDGHFILYRLALQGSPEAAYEIFNLFGDTEQNFLLQLLRNFPKDVYTPLEVAIDRNDIDMVIYFHDKIQVSRNRILFRCLFGHQMTVEDVETRILIFDKLVESDTTEPCTMSSEDLRNFLKLHATQEKVDKWSPIKFALNHRLELRGMSRTCKLTLLRKALNYANDEELILVLISLFGTRYADMARETDNAYNKAESADDVVPYNLNLDAARNTFSKNSDQPIFERSNFGLHLHKPATFKQLRSLRTLQLLVTMCPDYSKCNWNRWSYLHCAVNSGKVEWMEYLINCCNCDVNQKDGIGRTPLQCISTEMAIEVTQMLINNGADIYAVNTYKQNVAHQFHENCSHEDLEVVLGWMTFMLDKGHKRLWTAGDCSDETALDIIISKLGAQHPFLKRISVLMDKYKDNFTSNQFNDLQSEMT